LLVAVTQCHVAITVSDARSTQSSGQWSNKIAHCRYGM
jgi:hypothetical protein